MSLSMTGYGQSAVDLQGYNISFEVKSVNHRYCEIAIRMPREWACFEDSLRKAVQSRIGRGRIDVYINKENNGESTSAVLNHAMVQAYLQAAEDLKSYGIKGDLAVRDILSLPDVLVSPSGFSMDEAQQKIWNDALLQGLEQALDGLLQMRSREGAFLARDIEQRLGRLELLHQEMTELAPEVPNEYRKRLRQRIESLDDGSLAVDEHIFGLEVALFAERSNVEEELIRLRSHFEQCRGLLHQEGPVGRKLDFLIQEMNREVNTIGSKANHLTLVNRVVEMKAELEKIREQAANVE
ncbi:stress-induced protein [Bacillus sp. FJAT-18019]|uniref:Stress-induced protein n=1 Tax=Paenibacillus solani TaxID=1705565 RepID=A0A0M1P399_9BACL|nr:YicC/YloC family endoribonuclease [Paenibacillus solani]KOP64046.1 stress-induced protein [Bacillus sp. FJAT-18019]KOR88534.1 stress-induced protein [Paenibacillus solani]